MPSCFVPLCEHSDKNSTCKWLRFPRNVTKKNEWIEAVRRENKLPTDNSLVCSCHFVDGKRENGPTIFKWNIQKRLRVPSPEKPKKKTITTVAALQSLTIRDLAKTSASSVLSDTQNYFLLQENAELKKKLPSAFSFDAISNNDMRITMYTGLPDARTYKMLFHLLEHLEFDFFLGWKVDKIPKQDQLVLTLMKLKLNVPNEDLGVRFGCSNTTVRNIFMTWTYVIYEALYNEYLTKMPSRNKSKACLPSSFANYTNCRIVIDCTETYIEVPRALHKQKSTYSSYKHRNTFKGLVGVAPNGVIIFLSAMYAGSTSDKKIVAHCGILQLLTAGDLVIADKGFLISDILPAGVSLNIPPFLQSLQFTPEQISKTKSIAKARIHVERAIQRIKEYRILQLIPYNLQEHINIIWKVCATLTNFSHPLIKEIGSKFNE